MDKRQVLDALAEVLRHIDDGDLDASAVLRAYIAGATDVLYELVDDAD